MQNTAPIADDGFPISGLATISELAAIVSLSRSKIYQKINDGAIPSVTFGPKSAPAARA